MLSNSHKWFVVKAATLALVVSWHYIKAVATMLAYIVVICRLQR